MTKDATTAAYISLGSNCADAARMLACAARRVGRLAGVEVQAASPVYSTEPQEDANQPWFLNQVLKLGLVASWRAPALVTALLDIETAMGRVRDPARRFGPRVIDLDLLLFGEERCAAADCTVPHPRLLRRAFVLVPLLDVAPGISLDGVPLSGALQELDFRLCGNKIFQ
ncbi:MULTISPECIES: 2-amino-4-hydroxy-6-hydroxymethyldihydropteridine diphosphokinase [unclassified Desulfovibrio]|uniref:2-amino-4-hydroxy-6- hydroxymethyldihydropteridine diphosphokinase n=1 Tax=unclassified Desulfovibrio TaxID=2593640 RepID=UPI0013EE04B0|nr:MULTISPECIES: 2-amino-4-hydroxy-6-hydroxymethyldihydropteridine diphosphokinase [unclassified Desulfovibrio]